MWQWPEVQELLRAQRGSLTDSIAFKAPGLNALALFLFLSKSTAAFILKDFFLRGLILRANGIGLFGLPNP